MSHLTSQERNVLTIVIVLLLTGLLVQKYRTAHPPKAPGAAAVKASVIAQDGKP